MTKRLTVQIRDDALVIEIGVSTLAFAALSGPYFDRAELSGTKVVDVRAFARSMALALNREEEDGTTPVHRMLDAAAEWVVEQGEEGVEILSEEDELVAYAKSQADK